MIRQFHLSPPETGCGISCDADGAFTDAVPLLGRVRKDGQDAWQPRDCEALSETLSEHYGLPIDMSAKMGGLKAIANALNDDDLVRAQIATVLLGIPNPPQLSKDVSSRDQTIQFIRDLHWSRMLKWDSDKHPRWPAGSSDGKGGEFAPKGDGDDGGAPTSRPDSNEQKTSNGERENSHQSATVQLADLGISDASDDPMIEAAERRRHPRKPSACQRPAHPAIVKSGRAQRARS